MRVQTELENFFASYVEAFAQDDAEALSQLWDPVELFPNVAEARVAYRMLGEGDTVIAEWEHIYILRRADQWRVSLTIADGEMAAWGDRAKEF